MKRPQTKKRKGQAHTQRKPAAPVIPTPQNSTNATRPTTTIAEKATWKDKLWSTCKTPWGIAVGIITIFGLVQNLISLQARISVVPAQAVDPKNPFSTLFLLSNDGMLPIYHIHKEMRVLEATSEGNNRIENFRAADVAEYPYLKAGRKTTLNISAFWASSIDAWIAHQPITRSTMEIRISYKPTLLFWEKQEVFRFQTFPNSEHELFWIPLEYDFNMTTNGLSASPITN